ncbi:MULTISPECIES: hypothetical protein [unclassified Psychrobacter]|uniref:hypothetical protein n=1 Tax=unclassified Psychrobacter TaxID=196806 RepID=UPI000946FFBA|nr:MULTISPECIES: hypothetical protein [unclassified Psychrobacter]OLF36801.1 hypothetical protein BTV98_10385 [Psychrobacter sp. Cmf 22.2]
MSDPTKPLSKRSLALEALACYLQLPPSAVSLPVSHSSDIQYSACQYFYKLPVGELRILEVSLPLPITSSTVDIETARIAVIKAAMIWQKHSLQHHEDSETASHAVLVIDVQLVDNQVLNTDKTKDGNRLPDTESITYSFGAGYFMEHLVADVGKDEQMLQVFSRQDWHLAIERVQTPCDLWQFLDFHLAHLRQSLISGVASFESETALISQFMHSNALLSHAISVDNALIKNGLQDEPNSALIAMSLAQKQQDMSLQQTYHQHQEQASILWSQLSRQIISLASEPSTTTNKKVVDAQTRWQRQLLDESLFSRHELIRTLYKHSERALTMREHGYVIHQHSYTSLGRHYVMIFYGKGKDTVQSRAAIQPRLQAIAQDVTLRLPLVELHHIIVLGIEFVLESDETYLDIDAWIQPVEAMTQKERQLTKQLQRLNQQNKMQVQNNQPIDDNQSTRMQLNLNVPARPTKL